MEEFDNYIVPNTIYVHFANAPTAEVLGQVEGVTGVEDLGGQQFRVRFTDAQEVIERLVDLSTEQHWRMQEIRQEKNSLDTIFAKLTEKGN